MPLTNLMDSAVRSPANSTVQPEWLLSLNFQSASPADACVWLREELRFRYCQPAQLYEQLGSWSWVPPIQMFQQTPSMSPQQSRQGKTLIRILHNTKVSSLGGNVVFISVPASFEWNYAFLLVVSTCFKHKQQCSHKVASLNAILRRCWVF